MTLPFQFNTESGPSLQPVYRRLSQSISDAIAGGQLEAARLCRPVVIWQGNWEFHVTQYYAPMKNWQPST